jgi:hypothetical protein
MAIGACVSSETVVKGIRLERNLENYNVGNIAVTFYYSWCKGCNAIMARPRQKLHFTLETHDLKQLFPHIFSVFWQSFSLTPNLRNRLYNRCIEIPSVNCSRIKRFSHSCSRWCVDNPTHDLKQLFPHIFSVFWQSFSLVPNLQNRHNRRIAIPSVNCLRIKRFSHLCSRWCVDNPTHDLKYPKYL